MTTPSKPVELTVVDTNSAVWELLPVAHINANLEQVPLLNDDEETGVMIVKMVYRAGFTNPWHSHSYGHGFYVLDGTLKTHRAGDFPAGGFVWFPEGAVMEHGATEDADCTFLFITNKAFDIHFVGGHTDPDTPPDVTLLAWAAEPPTPDPVHVRPARAVPFWHR